ncbi:MAG: cell wall-binding repeat-containing protein [Erysipelotrichaceae bacterium]|nr:cell wall-binding repeat-containing protein [Erysipelotrichaceae bacterium]
MKIRKYITAILCAFLLLGHVPVSAEADKASPEIVSITLDKTEVTAPGEVEVTVEASDDVSGVRNVQMAFHNKEYDCYYYLTLQPDENGQWHGVLQLNEYAKPGEYVINYILAEDNAGNNRSYSYGNAAQEFPFKDITFTVSGGILDTVPPIFTEIILDKTEVQLPGEISITADMVDDLSGAAGGEIYFFNEKYQKELRVLMRSEYKDPATGETIPYADGRFHGTLPLDEFEKPGDYVISCLYVYDKASNKYDYFRYNPDFPEQFKDIRLTLITSGKVDDTAPEVKSVLATGVSYHAPGEIEVIAEASDDLSGVDHLNVYFHNDIYNSQIFTDLYPAYRDPVTGEMIPYEDGLLHGTITMDAYTKPGIYYLDSVYAYDRAGNFNFDSSYSAFPKRFRNVLVEVINDGEDDVIHTVNGDGLINILQNAGQNTPVIVDCSSDTILRENAYQNIKKGSRTVFFDCGNILWEIRGGNGSNLIPGDRDLSVQIRTLEELLEDGDSEAEIIRDHVKGKPALIVDFVYSGMIPGINLFGIKIDSKIKEYLGEGYITRYLYNENFREMMLQEEKLYIRFDDTIQYMEDQTGRYVFVAEPVTETSRLSGKDRYETSVKQADAIREVLGVEKYDTIVLATGKNYADALAGGYLASEMDAPILLTDSKKASSINEYIQENLKENGTVYVLGGEGAVPAECLEGLEESYSVERLSGSNRYLTNLAILEETSTDKDAVLICTGAGQNGYADSLSASAIGLPVLLVNGKGSLTAEQKQFLADHPFRTRYIIGGTGAVSETIEKEVSEYGTTVRISGKTRQETSAKIADMFFPEATSIILAYSDNYPDGLCAGPLASKLSSPILLVKEGKEAAAAEYVAKHDIKTAYIAGGTGAVPEEVVRKIIPE